MKLSHEKRRKRKNRMLAAIRGGMSRREAARVFGLSYGSVVQYCRGMFPRRRAANAKSDARARAREARNLERRKQREQKRRERERQQVIANAELPARFAEWKRTHVTSCRDYPEGQCCRECHADPLMMELVELPGDCHAHICCAKLRANWNLLGFRSVEASGNVSRGKTAKIHRPPRSKCGS